MIFELMSSGKLAKLPPASVPEGMPNLAEPYVMLLLPHNRYILGRPVEGAESWSWGRPGGEMEKIYLYEGERLTLSQEGMPTVTLSEETVSLLRRELLSRMEPPGDHQGTVLLLRGLMKGHAAFAEGVPFQDERSFMRCLRDDAALRGAYWTLRFAAARGDFDEMVRLRVWLRVAGLLSLASSQKGEDGTAAGNGARLWFSILDMPDESALQELEGLSFSLEDLRRMAAQRVSPILMFNPQSGYLVLARFGRNGSAPSFFIWAFLPPLLWGELRERRKLSVHEILLALWGQHDVERALAERQLYAPLGDAREEPCREESVLLLHA